MAKSYKVTVFAGTKVVADMAQQVKNATIDASLELKPIAGGATEATAVLLPIPNPLPTNSNRKRTNAIGWYKNATGPAWEAPKDADNVNWWSYETGLWSLGSSVPKPKGKDGQGILPLWSASFIDPDSGLAGYKKDTQVRDSNGTTYVSKKDTNTSSLTNLTDWQAVNIDGRVSEIIQNKTGSWEAGFVALKWSDGYWTLTGGTANVPWAKRSQKIPVKKGMVIKVSVGLSATAGTIPYALFFDTSDTFKSYFGTFTPQNSPVPITVYTLTILDDGFITLNTSTDNAASSKVEITPPDNIYVAPSNVVKDIEYNIPQVDKKENDVTSAESVSQFVKSNFTKVTYLANRLKDEILSNDFVRMQEANSATSSSFKVEDSLYKIQAAWSPTGDLPFNALRVGYNFKAANLQNFINDRFVFVIKGRAKGSNCRLAFKKGTVSDILINNLTSDWQSFEYKFAGDFRGNLQGADYQWIISLINVTTATPASIEIEISALGMFKEIQNFATSDYINVLNNSVGYVPFSDKKILKSPYKGLKMCTLGHSIVYQNQWQPLLSELLGTVYDLSETRGIVTKQPLGLGGSWFRAVYTNSTPWSYDVEPSQANGKQGSSIYTRADWVAQYKPDLIFVFNPTNDTLTPALVGEVTDPIYTGAELSSSDANAPTVISSVKGIFKKLGQQNPTAKIVFCSDLLNAFNYNDPQSALDRISNANLVSRHNKFKTVCEMFGVQFIDLLHNTWNVYEASSYFIPTDTVHPNSLGGEKIAKNINSVL
ncbi:MULTISPECIES: SGNH/GDSL hydrolase family protein [Sphingobacterium]|uniref:SGNH/GDSL hydrolase family protein n=1 Tax=Sphingobacterium TaxID=28453 RepID=UPI002580037C|nr:MULTISPECIES: SGNH/GDSL hydrolase family protein [Sphingobacterium]